ncbi:glycosyltransferase [Legionella sp. CNM-4043-24]|uniref:glycosyltransferase n=1 Tax=Legionella sp. CNM-4043-24 TaxID=3421646 RepID=UPI00403AD80C
MIPVVTLLLQFLLVGLHGLRNHYNKCASYTPNVAIIVPVRNEVDVIGTTIDCLVNMNYPDQNLRVYVIDDDSDDGSDEVIRARAKEHPGLVFYQKCIKEGFGKAAVLNHGLKIILADPWAEAIVIIDADVLFEQNTLAMMTRHLVDPDVGAVTAYIREGQYQGNLVSHFIGFEYVVAQAAARRSQNVLGVLACLAGGAQLHKRSNIEALGGRIDTSTLAEDTYTTMATQLTGARVLFDGHATAIAEEPDNITDLWKQRYRWSRGNVQISRLFRKLWFRPKHPSGLGGIFFGLIWFSTLLMPITMILSAVSLDALFFLQQSLSWTFLRMLSVLSLVAYLFITFFSFILDPRTARRAWFAGLMFPGLISVINMCIAVAPGLFAAFVTKMFNIDPWQLNHSYFILWINSWVALCMPAAWLVYRMDKAGVSQKITNVLLVLVGYGPLLCAITFASYLAELANLEMKWNKTVKQGKVQSNFKRTSKNYDFKTILAQNKRYEKRLFIYEVLFLALLIYLVYLRSYFGLS